MMSDHNESRPLHGILECHGQTEDVESPHHATPGRGPGSGLGPGSGPGPGPGSGSGRSVVSINIETVKERGIKY